jgi:hypothetical protein
MGGRDQRMSQITDKGRAAVREIAARNQVSEETVMALLHALQRGHGTAAQFNIDELGGMGQWSRGGMTQVGDMFNDGLKRKVGEICAELSKLLDRREAFDEANEPQEHSPDGSAKPKGGGTHWWPDELGSPSSTGGQNDAQYALFPGKRRLAVKQGERVSVYDSGEHDISGFSQAQGGGAQTLTFSSQHGRVSTADLRKVG